MLNKVKLASVAGAALAGMCLIASPVLAQQGVTKDEVKCESGTGKALTKFTGSKTKCLSKCVAAARKTSGPYTGCFAPYTDPATITCIQDSTKGAEAKARAAIVKACTKDCPECYAASTCSTGEPNVSSTETLLDLQGPSVSCVENGGGTPTKGEAKCEDGNVKALVKFVGAISKCYDKCNLNIFNGKIPEGSCTAGSPSDTATQACLSKARSSCTAAIDKACFIAPATAPSCYDGSLLRPNTGAGWSALVETIVNGTIPGIACGSPSGAFVN